MRTMADTDKGLQRKAGPAGLGPRRGDVPERNKVLRAQNEARGRGREELASKHFPFRQSGRGAGEWQLGFCLSSLSCDTAPKYLPEHMGRASIAQTLRPNTLKPRVGNAGSTPLSELRDQGGEDSAMPAGRSALDSPLFPMLGRSVSETRRDERQRGSQRPKFTQTPG